MTSGYPCAKQELLLTLLRMHKDKMSLAGPTAVIPLYLEPLEPVCFWAPKPVSPSPIHQRNESESIEGPERLPKPAVSKGNRDPRAWGYAHRREQQV